MHSIVILSRCKSYPHVPSIALTETDTNVKQKLITGLTDVIRATTKNHDSLVSEVQIMLLMSCVN